MEAIGLLLWDNKYDLEKNRCFTDPIARYMENYISSGNSKEFEDREFAHDFYDKFGWSAEKEYDIINSFWTTFSFAMHFSSPKEYPIAEAGNVKIYKNGFRCRNRYLPSFPEKYTGKVTNSSKVQNDVIQMLQTFGNVSALAELCHCVANYMPCPIGFNEAKGLAPEVRDYFPLMIDKIQECVDMEQDLMYEVNEELRVVKNSKLREWHTYFIKNQQAFCLQDYYSVDNGKIAGKKLFSGQSLKKATPTTPGEVSECLDNMVKRIHNRAEQLSQYL